jgi:hypothetical protein
MTQLEREKLITMALFKATVEQSTQLIKKFKHQTKRDFNLCLNQGFNVLEAIENNL